MSSSEQQQQPTSTASSSSGEEEEAFVQVTPEDTIPSATMTTTGTTTTTTTTGTTTTPPLSLSKMEPASASKESDKMSAAADDDDGSTTRLHIVNDEKKLTKSLSVYMKERWKLFDRGLDYHIVAIFGSQSTGKSTLLNLLFGTHFDVMRTDRRRQTTKGIWMSVGTLPDVIVTDVEGTDGKERGEDQDMERRSALFSLAIAEVLIINMFENDIGRYNGANYGLLKTVFEVNLSLFQTDSASQKTLLLFIIRDHTSTPMDSLKETLESDMLKIWSEFSKPSGLEHAQMADYFDFDFYSLPHKIFEEAKFLHGTNELREWFHDPTNPHYVFHSEYHKKIPADGFEFFTQDIWDKIITNRDLDLPTQRQLLAQYRCDEISRACGVAASTSLQATTKQLDNGDIVDGLGDTLAKIRAQAFADYDSKASKYDRDVYVSVKNTLDNDVCAKLHLVYLQQLKNLTRKCKETLQQQIKNMPKDKSVTFHQYMEGLQKRVMDEFAKVASASVLAECQWSFEEEQDFLRKEVQHEIERQRDIEIEKSMDKLKKSAEQQVLDSLAETLNELPDDLWQRISGEISKAAATIDTGVGALEKDYGLPKGKGVDVRRELTDFMMAKVKDKLISELSEMSAVAKLKRRFERIFKYDDSKRPRFWKPTDNIAEVFDSAKSSAEKTLQILANSTLDISKLKLNTSVEFDGRFITDPQKRLIWDHFEDEAGILYREAQRSVNQSVTQIPPWILVLLLVVGWNEIVFILTSPMYLIMFLFLGAVLFFLHRTGLDVPVLGMLKEVANAGTSRLLELGQERINGYRNGRSSATSTSSSSARASRSRPHAD